VTLQGAMIADAVAELLVYFFPAHLPQFKIGYTADTVGVGVGESSDFGFSN